MTPRTQTRCFNDLYVANVGAIPKDFSKLRSGIYRENPWQIVAFHENEN